MSTDPVDLPSVLERIGGEKEFLHELLDLFNKDFEEKIGRLREALEKEDFRSIGEIGHALKGASSNLSLLPLQAACRSLEEAGRGSDIVLAREALSRMEKEHARLQAFIPGMFE